MLVVVMMMLMPVLMLMLMLIIVLVLMLMLMIVLVLMLVLMLVLFTRAAATMYMRLFCHVSLLHFIPFLAFPSFLYRLQSYDMFAATGLHFKGKKVKKGWRLGKGKTKSEK